VVSKPISPLNEEGFRIYLKDYLRSLKGPKGFVASRKRDYPSTLLNCNDPKINLSFFRLRHNLIRQQAKLRYVYTANMRTQDTWFLLLTSAV
jgi:hypothetical protein